jgi:glycosyltransferase involved in cell wall biosynthesis
MLLKIMTSMRCPSLNELLPSPPGKTGWPWTEESELLPDAMPDGAPWPKISIVTPSFNQGQFIEETIRSVLLQGYPNLEYIIMDGGSTDASVDIIRKYELWLTYWVSESDRGQADAIGKGFDKATGARLGWINSDDLLMPGALFTVAVLHKFFPQSLIAGSVSNFHVDSGQVDIIRQRNITLKVLLRLWERSTCWHQPGLFFPRSAYQMVGGLDRSLRYTMDHDLLCRLLRMNIPVIYTDQVLARFRLHAASKTMAENTKMVLEAYQVSGRYWHLLGDSYRYYAFRMLAHLMLRAAKWLLRGEWDVAMHSLKGGIKLFMRRKE